MIPPPRAQWSIKVHFCLTKPIKNGHSGSKKCQKWLSNYEAKAGKSDHCAHARLVLEYSSMVESKVSENNGSELWFVKRFLLKWQKCCNIGGRGASFHEWERAFCKMSGGGRPDAKSIYHAPALTQELLLWWRRKLCCTTNQPSAISTSRLLFSSCQQLPRHIMLCKSTYFPSWCFFISVCFATYFLSTRQAATSSHSKPRPGISLCKYWLPQNKTEKN